MAELYKRTDSDVKEKVLVLSRTYNYEPFETETYEGYNNYLENTELTINNFIHPENQGSLKEPDYYIPFRFSSGTNTEPLGFVNYSYANNGNGFSYASLANNYRYNNTFCMFNFYDLMNELTTYGYLKNLFSQDQINRGWSSTSSIWTSEGRTDTCFFANPNQTTFFQTKIQGQSTVFSIKPKKINQNNLYISTETTSYKANEITVSSNSNTQFNLGYQMLISAQGNLKQYFDNMISGDLPFWKKYFAVSIKGGYSSAGLYDVSNAQCVKLCTVNDSLPYNITCKKVSDFIYYLEDKNFKTYNLYPISNGGYQTKISVPILMAPQRPLWYFDTTAHFVARYANDGATRYYYKGPMKVADIDPSKLDTYWYEISSSNVLYKVGNNYEISYIDENKNWVPHISAAKFDTTGALLTDAYDMDLVNFFISGTSGSTDIYYVSGDGSRETHWTRYKNQKKIFDTEQEVMTKYNSLDSNAKRYLSPVPTFDLKDNYKFFYLDYFSATNFNETGEGTDFENIMDYMWSTAHYANLTTVTAGGNYGFSEVDFTNKTSSVLMCEMPQVKCVALNYFITEL